MHRRLWRLFATEWVIHWNYTVFVDEHSIWSLSLRLLSTYTLITWSQLVPGSLSSWFALIFSASHSNTLCQLNHTAAGSAPPRPCCVPCSVTFQPSSSFFVSWHSLVFRIVDILEKPSFNMELPTCPLLLLSYPLIWQLMTLKDNILKSHPGDWLIYWSR